MKIALNRGLGDGMELKSDRMLEIQQPNRPKPPEAITSQDPTPAPAARSFPIVGIGASAGGLAAFESFFSGMPPDVNPGMAFVLVQHLAPDHTGQTHLNS